MNASQLRETTLDPNTRRLVQLDLDDVHLTSGLLDKLLAKNAPVTVKTGWNRKVTWRISLFKYISNMHLKSP